MRALRLIGKAIIALVLLAVGVVLALRWIADAKDANTRQKISGTWITDWNDDFSWKIEQTPSVNFSVYGVGASEGWKAEGGTWEINKGILILTMTNAPWENGTLGVRRYKISRFDEHKMVLMQVGADEPQTLHKK